MSNSNTPNYVPVYPFVGPTALTPQQITAPGMIYKDAITGNILSGPVSWGDKRPDGVPYHGGVLNEAKTTIAFHRTLPNPNFTTKK